MEWLEVASKLWVVRELVYIGFTIVACLVMLGVMAFTKKKKGWK